MVNYGSGSQEKVKLLGEQLCGRAISSDLHRQNFAKLHIQHFHSRTSTHR